MSKDFKNLLKYSQIFNNLMLLLNWISKKWMSLSINLTQFVIILRAEEKLIYWIFQIAPLIKNMYHSILQFHNLILSFKISLMLTSVNPKALSIVLIYWRNSRALLKEMHWNIIWHQNITLFWLIMQVNLKLFKESSMIKSRILQL